LISDELLKMHYNFFVWLLFVHGEDGSGGSNSGNTSGSGSNTSGKEKGSEGGGKHDGANEASADGENNKASGKKEKFMNCRKVKPMIVQYGGNLFA
jgi:hypothetical protein